MVQPRRIVFLHGFTQTHHHWHRAAFELDRRLGGEVSVVLPDLPGHGLSADDHRAIAAASSALTSLGGPGTYVGYSMGGRFALVAACSGAPEIERLVLIGATPGIESEDQREARRLADEERARSIESHGVWPFLDEWLAMPMFAALADDPDDREHRLRNTAAGLASSLRGSGTGSQPDLWQRLGTIDVPVLVIAGELDEKFTAIGRRMSASIPRGTFAPIPGAGHAAHLERPEATVALIAEWLRDQPEPSARPTASRTP